MGRVSLRQVRKSFGTVDVIKGIDLEVKKGERVVVCGPSGSGKSTMTRCINRRPDLGDGIGRSST